MRYSPSGYYGNHLGIADRHAVVDFLFAIQGSVCLICARYLRKRDATIDHVIPRAKNGPHHLGNWALAHRSCNHAKGDRLPNAEEIARHQRLLRKINDALFRLRVAAFWRRVGKLVGWRR